MIAPLIEVRDLGQESHPTKGLLQSLRVEKGKIIKGDRVVHTVNKVNFQIEKDKIFSLVGGSGYGKSTTARTIIRLLEPSGGQVLYRGEDISHLSPGELLPYREGMQMIFQDPHASLNPKQRVEDIIMEPILFHGVAKDKSNTREQCMNILNRARLRPERAGRYPHQFPGGQRQHIEIARALAVKPEFIIADEPVSALDVSIQAQILSLLVDLGDEFHFSYLFIAHDLSAVRHISGRLGVMYLGVLVGVGNKQALLQNPLRPYTKVLLSAVPTVGEKPLMEYIDAAGEIPNPVNLPKGCFFCEHCPYIIERCRREHPELRGIEPGHQAACHMLRRVVYRGGLFDAAENRDRKRGK